MSFESQVQSICTTNYSSLPPSEKNTIEKEVHLLSCPSQFSRYKCHLQVSLGVDGSVLKVVMAQIWLEKNTNGLPWAGIIQPSHLWRGRQKHLMDTRNESFRPQDCLYFLSILSSVCILVVSATRKSLCSRESFISRNNDKYYLHTLKTIKCSLKYLM